jgi:hypothetical protein
LSSSSLNWKLSEKSDTETEEFKFWTRSLKQHPGPVRKHWEHYQILESLHKADLLHPGSRGLGFGVGCEQIAALFAKYGCEVVVTDVILDDKIRKHWLETDQHCGGDISVLNRDGIATEGQWAARARFEYADMRHIPARLKDFDFCWSTNSLDHLGSYRLGFKFLMDSLNCLKPGGLSVHTTEYNTTSLEESYGARKSEEPFDTVFFRKRDISEFHARCKRNGIQVGQLKLSAVDPLTVHNNGWEIASVFIGMQKP